MQSGQWIADQVRNDSHFKPVLLQFPSSLARYRRLIVNRLRRHMGQVLYVGPVQNLKRVAVDTHAVQAGVGNVALAWPRQRQGTRRAIDHVEHAAMRDHNQCLVRMRQRQRTHGCQHAGVKLARTLATCKSRVGIKSGPLRPGVGVLRLDIANPHAIDHAKVLFP